MQFVGDLCNPSPLVASPGQLVGGRLTRTVTSGNRRRAVRRTTRDLLNGRLPCVPVIQADNHHTEVKEIRDDVEERGLLAAMLRARGGEGATHLSVQGPAHPKAASLVQETGHLR
jgi:hypothetical protein